MYALRFPDWKKIGWHVGKKLRDILTPPTHNGPSREERRAQRLRDSLKGFVYLDDFDEVGAWSPEDVDSMQRANVPILERSASGVHDQKGSTTSVMLCHDYNGGYHDYESVRPPLLENKLFRCNHLQHVEIFVYFSHKLVCVPPPTWTNTMHRNGVKVLGTFMIEPHTPQIERMLEQKEGEFIIARQLAMMANAYGFDGWLLNVEGEFPRHVGDYLNKVTGFISSLRFMLRPAGRVVWYDALTSDNEVDYQNSLTPKNLMYVLAADAVFTNYRWTIAKLEGAQILAQKNRIKSVDVFFGVDVWAQNTNMPGPPRVTYPSKGGGGTNTGVALSVLADRGFSTAIFAPAWTHEHFSVTSHRSTSITKAESVEQSMWEGRSLPTELGCDCKEGKPHHTSLYQAYPILRNAREYPAGSSTFFETDFQGAFEESEDGSRLCSRLGFQTVLPHIIPMPRLTWEVFCGSSERVIYGELADNTSQGLVIKTKVLTGTGEATSAEPQQPDSRSEQSYRLCLFKLNMPADGSLEANVRLKRGRSRVQAEVGLFTAYRSASSGVVEYCHCGIGPGELDLGHLTIALNSEMHDSHLIELGFYSSGYIETPEPLTLCQLFHITIKPRKKAPFPQWRITDPKVIERGDSENRHNRLAWTWHGLDNTDVSPVNGLPWSKTTGPFSYFVVRAQETEIGRVHCMEFPLQEEDFRGGGETECRHLDVVVEGVLFGGGLVSSQPVTIPKGDWDFL